MDEESIPCIECGNPVLPRTANRNAGKCVPCARGYRESLEKARLYYEEEKRYRTSPDALFWRSLCERVDNPALGFETLREPEQIFFAVCLLEGEVYNGGFEQYFTNSSSDYFDYALRGLAAMGDTEGLKITRRAKQLLFGDSEVSVDRVSRYDVIERCGLSDSPETVHRLNELDSLFVKNFEENLSSRLRQFAAMHYFWESETEN
jgi:hypothetical protein